jgi:histidinol-phosphate aminotransferase
MHDPRLRPVLDRLPSYGSGRDGESDGRSQYLLGANESPYGPLPEIVEAVIASAYKVNRYPDCEGRELIAQIAHTCGVSEDRVAVGAGSVALLQILLQAIAEPDSEVLHAWRSFEFYPTLAALAGVQSICVPLVDEAHDLQQMADMVTGSTRLIIICNPNNPTGTALGLVELEDFLAQVPPDCLVALDEAYYEYMRAPNTGSGLELQDPPPNLVILRTFSKAYGLAGLRVGYLVGNPRVVAQLRKAYTPYSLNVAAQAAALAALRAPGAMLMHAEEIVAERTRMRDKLLAAGWRVPDSQANFLWLRLNSRTTAFREWCDQYGIEVRSFSGEGVRVSIGTPPDNDAFTAAADEWAARMPAGQWQWNA